MSAVIEPFGWWHIPAAVRIELELFDIQPWTEAQFWGELALEDRRLFAAVDGDALVGYADLRIASDETEILNIAVRTADQGKGVGYALLRAMLDASDDVAAQRVLLEVRAGNDIAIKLYERNGFRTVGHRPNYYALGVDGVLMERHV